MSIDLGTPFIAATLWIIEAASQSAPISSRGTRILPLSMSRTLTIG
jgi:hypothetical protein